MYNLEQLIAEWSETMRATPGVGRATLDELECHLRDSVEPLLRSGMSETEAFQRAVAQLGGASAIASEFQKLERRTWLPVKLVTGFAITAALALAIVLILRLGGGRSDFLLASHVFTVVLGYSTTLLVGTLGICFVGQRCFSDLSPSQLRFVRRATFRLGCVAAGLTAIGVILAMVWTKREWGRYWGWDAKEIGGLAVVIWQVFFLSAHRFARDAARGVLVMGVLGNIVVGLGWFGANLLSQLHSYGAPNYWLLLLMAVASNFTFFLIGLAPAGWLRSRAAS